MEVTQMLEVTRPLRVVIVSTPSERYIYLALTVFLGDTISGEEDAYRPRLGVYPVVVIAEVNTSPTTGLDIRVE